MHSPHAQRGQAAVELVAVLPLVVALLAGLWQLALAGHAGMGGRGRALRRRRARRRSAATRAQRRARRLPAPLERGLRVRVRSGSGGEVKVTVRVPSSFGLRVGSVSRERALRAPAMRRLRESAGQSTVEVVGLLPLLLAAGAASTRCSARARPSTPPAGRPRRARWRCSRDATRGRRRAAALGDWPAPARAHHRPRPAGDSPRDAARTRSASACARR